METIAIISQKGGSGKTTIALHLAVSSSNAGLNTALIDLDPQASATKWADRRKKELPVVLSAHASRLHYEIQRVKETGGQRLFLDTAPHSDSAALEAAKVADLVLIPCRPAIFDMEAISNTLSLVQTTGTPIFVVMNAVAPQGQEAEEAKEAIGELNVDVCPIQLVNRIAFARSLITGLTAQEFECDGKAAKEIENMHTFMCAQLNKLNHKL
ncbi:ParA family protein [Nitrosomonas supralitoralis]|uniref:Chromosome partitioning protein ParA n=1 Tax=Nitrosomonas supralitoralis TaxID=2116706 RepID=A0A2P7NQU5_9PROT|nr:ParA family protein [Nitrosomonas supralitoralis]PSJ15817.1 chromosome partitioning protein ParA [Nitrosomonas supralitoralis]